MWVGTDGTVASHELIDGSEVWKTPGKSASASVLVPIQDMVLLASGGKVLALDLDTGFLLWATRLAGKATSIAQCSQGGAVVVAVNDGGIYSAGLQGPWEIPPRIGAHHSGVT